MMVRRAHPAILNLWDDDFMCCLDILLFLKKVYLSLKNIASLYISEIYEVVKT